MNPRYSLNGKSEGSWKYKIAKEGDKGMKREGTVYWERGTGL